MNYNIRCTNCRDYTLHPILDDKDGKNQAIKCSNCGYELPYIIIISRRVSVSKALYDQHQDRQKNAK